VKLCRETPPVAQTNCSSTSEQQANENNPMLLFRNVFTKTTLISADEGNNNSQDIDRIDGVRDAKKPCQKAWRLPRERVSVTVVLGSETPIPGKIRN